MRRSTNDRCVFFSHNSSAQICDDISYIYYRISSMPRRSFLGWWLKYEYVCRLALCTSQKGTPFFNPIDFNKDTIHGWKSIIFAYLQFFFFFNFYLILKVNFRSVDQSVALWLIVKYYASSIRKISKMWVGYIILGATLHFETGIQFLKFTKLIYGFVFRCFFGFLLRLFTSHK